MDLDRLRDLGLTVRGEGDATEADLELTSAQLVNPLSRQFISKVTFSVLGDRLVAIDPPELLGITPLSVAALDSSNALEEQISNAFNEAILHVQRRSAELQALGVSPKVDPTRMSLTAEVNTQDGLHFVIASDKRGNFRVLSATKGQKPFDVSDSHAFDLSEFRERSALVGYLSALFNEPPPDAPTQPSYKRPVKPTGEPQVFYGEVVNLFGADAKLPPRSSLELLVELSVAGEVYRFAAARVAGRTFRGLLAGAKGKIWAERFELDDFPGVVPLVASLLKVPERDVTVLGGEA